MNRNSPDPGVWRITEMATHMPEAFVHGVDPVGDERMSPSSERIKRLALQKRRDYLDGKEATTMKRAPVRFMIAAAIAALMGVTVFAAIGGADFIRGIFGDSARSIENQIVTPQISASAGGRDLAVEALVTDGFVTNMVVSLTGNMPAEQGLFTVETDTSLRSNGWYVLEDFTVEGKTYYVVDLFSEQRFDSADITLSLNPEVAPITLYITVENKLGNALVHFPDGAMSGQVQLRELQVSPMGFLLIGHESDAQGGLPSTAIRLQFVDGTEETIEVEFAPSEETAGGGGGAVMADRPQDLPLASRFAGTRNPDGELVINGQFSRIIDPGHIERVVVQGNVYPVE